MSAKSCEIARKFIGIRAIRGVLHGVTGSSEAKSLYDEWLNRGHGVKNGRLDSLRGGLTLFLCQSLDLRHKGQGTDTQTMQDRSLQRSGGSQRADLIFTYDVCMTSYVSCYDVTHVSK